MTTYRSKETITAVKLTEEMAWAYLLEHAPLPEGFSLAGANYHPGNKTITRFRVTTKGRTPVGCPCVGGIGDWLVTDEQGRCYTADPETFEADYEPTNTSPVTGDALVSGLPRAWEISYGRDERPDAVYSTVFVDEAEAVAETERMENRGGYRDIEIRPLFRAAPLATFPEPVDSSGGPIGAAVAAQQADARDAARYRWLRDCRGIKLPTDGGWTWLFLDDADRFVDAAMTDTRPAQNP